jgi:NHL repeat
MFSLFERRALPALGAILALGGCGVPQGIVGTAGSLPPAAFDRHAHGGSWMSPEAKNQRLLYVSDSQANDVYVYTYPKGALVGTLTGFNEPWGLCSDRAGDVFIADVWNYRLVEYAHGGTSPIATFSDNDGHPTNCAIDPSTGNLAVTFYFLNRPGRKSEIAVYVGAKGTPRHYKGSKIGQGLWACTYDEHGNLFVDGTYGRTSVIVGIAELRKGHRKLIDISLGTWVQYLSGIQWADGYLAIADQSQGSHEATIYRLSLQGRKTVLAGTTELDGTQGVEQFWVEGDRVAAPGWDTAAVRLYHYPTGGAAKKTIGGLQHPFGVTVSKAPN